MLFESCHRSRHLGLLWQQLRETNVFGEMIRHCIERGPALPYRNSLQIAASVVQEIEDIDHDRSIVAAALLQQLEGGPLSITQSHEFSIENAVG